MLSRKLSLQCVFMLLFSICYITCFAQPVNANLVKQWQQARLSKNYSADTANVKLLNQLSRQYLYNNADSALYFAKQALEMAEAQKNKSGQALSLLNISRSYYVAGDFISSLNAATKSIAISNQFSNLHSTGEVYQVIGLIYQAEAKNDDAISNLKKALEIFIKQNDHLGASKAYFNIGLCYDEMGQPGKSFPYLDKAIESANIAGDRSMILMAWNRLGEANSHLKNYKQALNYYQRVIDAKSSSNWELDFALSGMANAYYNLGDYNKAITNAHKSLALANKVNSAQDKIRALTILAKCYAAINDYKQAYNYQTLFKNTSDSLFNNEKSREINSLHLKQQRAENAKLINEIKIKEQSITFSQRLLFFRNLIAACVIIFVIAIVRSNRQKTALNKVLQKQNEDIAFQKAEIMQQRETLHHLNSTKDKLFSVISHDLRAPFSAILQTMESIRTGDLSAIEQKEILDSFYQQVGLVNIMVNNLLTWAGSQQSGIKTDRETVNVTATINEVLQVSKFLAKNKRISLVNIYDTDKWVVADLNHVKIIFHNLIGNAIKFTPHGGTIEVYYTADEEYVAVHVKDNGIGILPQKMEKLFKVTGKDISGAGTNNEAGAGIGLGLIKQFVDANNGKLEVNSIPGEGSEFIVYLEKSDITTGI
ncbi:tetratricopeptide repeat-containing sensor histidine kinase [Mucilaginibacter xinganensis]|uniref:histidine kinase n=1 Tax=Mucilaginibacter xinganensis TaxID=1234841 RepID=A0A223NSR2_9SPHI|nr:tetratricopeptide repeat-containing sensor histidine kinase [Mucilaginibacter xinganensis]ASU32893.1 Signal transduction histidine kinase [Mucilaginibacter xinganensis]